MTPEIGGDQNLCVKTKRPTTDLVTLPENKCSVIHLFSCCMEKSIHKISILLVVFLWFLSMQQHDAANSLPKAQFFICFVTIQVTLSVFELASAAGFKCDIDPVLVAAISSMQTGNLNSISATHCNRSYDLMAESSKENFFIASCWVFVF